jgi:hypothetical protein
MLSAEEYEVAVQELDRLWAVDSAGQFRSRMDTLMRVIEDYERAMKPDGPRAEASAGHSE